MVVLDVVVLDVVVVVDVVVDELVDVVVSPGNVVVVPDGDVVSDGDVVVGGVSLTNPTIRSSGTNLKF